MAEPGGTGTVARPARCSPRPAADIAVPLWELRHRGDYEQFRTALTEGYVQHRPLPPGGLTHLDDFIATREVAFGLWYIGTAEVNPLSVPTFPRCRETSATRWTPFSETRRQAAFRY